MRKVIFILSTILFLYSCNGGGSSKFKHSPIDTSNTLIVARDTSNVLRQYTAQRYFKDTLLKMGGSDSIWARFKAYKITEMYYKTDSNGVVVRKKNGKDSVVVNQWGLLAENIILDLNIDSLYKLYPVKKQNTK